MSIIFAALCTESSSEKTDRIVGVTAAQIIENPSADVGKTETVSGEVEEVYNPRASLI